MSERITDERVQAIIDIYNDIIDRFGDCWKSNWESDIAAALTELLDRRAADTKPVPTEQGTLRDEFAMRFAVALVPLLGETDAGAAYRMADAMLAQRAKAKETEKP